MAAVRMPYPGVLGDSLIQWWYWTGHLTEKNPPAGRDPRRFGFEVCFFLVSPDAECPDVGDGVNLYDELRKAAVRQVVDKLRTTADPSEMLSGLGLGAPLETALRAVWTAGHLLGDLTEPLERAFGPFLPHLGVKMAHLALTDIDNQRFHHDVVIWPGLYIDGDRNSFDWSTPLGAVTAAGVMTPTEGGNGPASVQLSGVTSEFGLELDLEDPDLADLHYDGQLHPYSFGGNSWYYSRTRMPVKRGSVTVGGTRCDVEGDVWFDRQAGELVQAVLDGWQWFSIQLSGDVQIMLFFFNGTPGAPERMGSVTVGGTTTQLSASEFTVVMGSETWKSSASGVTYPASWTVDIAPRQPIAGFTPQTLNLAAEVSDQELIVLPELLRYWEGACSVVDDSGANLGQAYVELLPSFLTNGFENDEGG